MNLVASLLTQIAGGAGALALDEAKPDWTYRVGQSQSNPAGIAITPGMMAAVGTTLVLAMIPGKMPSPDAKMTMAQTVRSIGANLAGGALVAEGTQLAKDHLLPLLRQPGGPFSVPAGAVAPLMYGGVSGIPGRGLPQPQQYQVGVTDFELQRALAQYRMPRAA